LEKTCPSATLSTTNPTWPDPGSNSGCCGGKPASNRLRYGTAYWHIVWIKNSETWPKVRHFPANCVCQTSQVFQIYVYYLVYSLGTGTEKIPWREQIGSVLSVDFVKLFFCASQVSREISSGKSYAWCLKCVENPSLITYEDTLHEILVVSVFDHPWKLLEPFSYKPSSCLNGRLECIVPFALCSSNLLHYFSI
jgi:hypothetical protein